ncbi:transcriptional regulator [Levilactobacillus namurensis DSM 19117]|uniref:Transcriptional regulator n=2 Tax=Levilactobacillus namurensis TaxID=380393 RepID=A0A0R1K1T8_9LACO|nr:MarR family winged helix-turn-helix transcriptional regulator [Levilactobacillus namurensis]PTM22317.1 MarR family transcriptional regulator [Lactobacillus sp. PFC-70]KRK77035.1 transcriptional regulator [Levilactobacillus namurensis DSM 19117]MCW3777290.1 MarR family winged helix-turn-helix transcriptional regulator [Levilactobacillus namurensis]MDT7014424.1 MarR family winged helix-turn-helix transcriptional regulator [Levilactobacillus namurensis]MDT7018644.1 MarR family winged helix-tur
MKSSLAALMTVTKAEQTLLRRLTKAHHLTVAEWQLLDHIGGGANTQESLAEATRLDTSTLSRQLKGLVTKELISKKAVGRDKRQLIYTVTDQGAVTASAMNRDFEDLADQIFEHWSDDERNLLQILLNRLAKSMDRQRTFSEHS